MTPPSPLRLAVIQPTEVTLRGVEAIILDQPPGKTVDEALKRAEECVKYARARLVSGDELERLEARLASLKSLAEARLRDNVIGVAHPRRKGERLPSVRQALADFAEPAAQRIAPTVIRALESKEHYLSEKYQDRLVRLIHGNAVLPTEYKRQLHKDVAAVLRACPNAAGLVKELTLRGQHGATGSRSKLGSRGNSAIGSAYELMATATLTRKVSTPTNGGPRLHINSGVDVVTFGDKANINRQLRGDGKSYDMPTRRTIECDVRIGRSSLIDGYREIGIDFKHVLNAGVRSSSENHKNQVANVVKALQQGHLHEYHFVTNGTFGDSFKGVIDTANETLKDSGLSLIAYHEYVSSL